MPTTGCQTSAAIVGTTFLWTDHPDSVFERVGMDYACPLLVKYGVVRKPTIVIAYLCVFISMTVKAVNLELVSDLTSEAFIAALRRFIARRGYSHQAQSMFLFVSDFSAPIVSLMQLMSSISESTVTWHPIAAKVIYILKIRSKHQFNPYTCYKNETTVISGAEKEVISSSKHALIIIMWQEKVAQTNFNQNMRVVLSA